MCQKQQTFEVSLHSENSTISVGFYLTNITAIFTWCTHQINLFCRYPAIYKALFLPKLPQNSACNILILPTQNNYLSLEKTQNKNHSNNLLIIHTTAS